MNALKEKLKNRSRIFGTTLMTVEWTGIVEILKNDVLDFLLMDLEHSKLSIESIENIVRLCRYMNLPAIARVQDTNYTAISRTLDMGAGGILVPRVDTVEQAELIVSCARFYPEGKKGCGGFPLMRDTATVQAFNEERVIMMQMESPLGVESLPAILSRVRVDGIIVGPTDLTINSGHPMEFDHPQVLALIDRVIDICGSHGVSCGMYMNGSEIEKWHKKGMNILWAESDVSFLSRGYEALCGIIRGLP